MEMEPEGAYITPEGYIRAKAIVTRTGVFTYANADGTARKELRLPDEVFHDDSISSMRLIPITNGHPPEKLVTSENSKRLAVGFTGDVVDQNENYVLANLVITDAETVKMVQEQGRRELSLGYTVDLVPEQGEYNGERYDYKQTNIRYNHLALVDNARAGSAARIKLDGDDAVQIDGEKIMTAKKKVRIDNVEYVVEPAVAEVVEREQGRPGDREIDHLEDNVHNLTQELERVRKELEEQRGELERAKRERDESRAELDSKAEMNSADMIKRDSADFNKLVSERVKLVKTAGVFLNSEQMERLDGLCSIDIKKSVIQAAKKHVSLDGKSDTYIETMFDFIVADSHQQPILTNVQTGIKSDEKDALDPDQARKAMIARLHSPTKAK